MQSKGKPLARRVIPGERHRRAAGLSAILRIPRRNYFQLLSRGIRQYLIVGMAAAKINALKFVRPTGNIPENINFAVKTGMIRDLLDNSVVPYQTAEPKAEMKTTDIAGSARPCTLLISCTATEQAEGTKR